MNRRIRCRITAKFQATHDIIRSVIEQYAEAEIVVFDASIVRDADAAIRIEFATNHCMV